MLSNGQTFNVGEGGGKAGLRDGHVWIIETQLILKRRLVLHYFTLLRFLLLLSVYIDFEIVVDYTRMCLFLSHNFILIWGFLKGQDFNTKKNKKKTHFAVCVFHRITSTPRYQFRSEYKQTKRCRQPKNLNARFS